MKSLGALVSIFVAMGALALPAAARDTFVVDNAHLFSTATISAINAKVADFNATAHKEVVVDTEPTVDGTTPQAAAEKIFATLGVNGVLIYIAKAPKTVGVIPDHAARDFFPATTTSAIRTAIVSGFNSGDFNGGITNGVDLTLSQYRSHLGALTTHRSSYVVPVGGVTDSRASSQAGFGNMSWIFILIVLAVIFFIIRGIFRAMAGPRPMPPGYGGGPMMGGPGYGGGYGPGYGGGYGGGGGGGSFWSGLMGGLGGAFLGNELFGGRRDEFGGNEFGGNEAGFVDGGQGYAQPDTSGFSQDAGQADMGNASFGGWGGGGDSGGGGGWGGGDSGGGGDFGGGGDNSGGGGW